MSQLIVVFGATGKQGESVVRALLANGYKVRALTRNPDSTGGKSLQEKGCEVVKVDLDDEFCGWCSWSLCSHQLLGSAGRIREQGRSCH